MFTTLFCTFRIALFREMQHRYPKLTRGDRFCGICLGILGIVIQGSKREIKIHQKFSPCLFTCVRSIFGCFRAIPASFSSGVVLHMCVYVDRTTIELKLAGIALKRPKYAKNTREKQGDKVRSLSVCINNDC